MKFTTAVLCILLAFALFVEAKDGLKVILKFRFDRELTNAELDSDPFWKFDGIFIEETVPTIVSNNFIGQAFLIDLIEYHTNKQEVHIFTYLPPDDTKKYDQYDKLYTNKFKNDLIKGLNDVIKVQTDATKPNLVTESELIDENLKAKCFTLPANEYDSDCFPQEPGMECEDDDDCVYFSKCEVDVTPDPDPVPPACTTNADCKAPTPVCKVDTEVSANNKCVACVENSDCADDLTCDVATNTCGDDSSATDAFTLADDDKPVKVCSPLKGANGSFMVSTMAAMMIMILAVVFMFV